MTVLVIYVSLEQPDMKDSTSVMRSPQHCPMGLGDTNRQTRIEGAWTTVSGRLFHAATTRNEKKVCLMKVCALSLKIFLPCPRRVFAGSTVKNLLAKPCSNRAWLKWLEREFTDRKVRGSNPTSASRLPLSRLGQPGSISALVLPSGGMAARHRKGATAERFFFTISQAASHVYCSSCSSEEIMFCTANR
ncbi:hypothetical protein CSKR_101471 [Clonorchis sinensis]|uniref:Uncharacterized protein n=1 Tax=Clonorchis sinensis TaxID=79923 RepID=A0A3R7G9D6_CLOSI|nr:hypothetical protein CSKR_101471 [Clonorchis sinensis]